MPGPSLQDTGPLEEPEGAALDAQLKAWFDAMLQAPVPAYLLRHVERLNGEGGDEA